MLNVGIGEFIICNDETESIITYSLGSCVALIVYCPKTKHTALAHIVLPESDGRETSRLPNYKPGYFADIIVPQFVEFFIEKLNCKPAQLHVYLAGGANSLDVNDVFQVGPRNIESVKSILRKYRIVPYKMDVGGNVSRTVSVDIITGKVTVKSQNMIL